MKYYLTLLAFLAVRCLSALPDSPRPFYPVLPDVIHRSPTTPVWVTAAVPKRSSEASTLALRTPNGGEYYQAGKVVAIEWSASDVPEVTVEYRTEDGAAWMSIATVDASAHSYAWTVPGTVTETARVRISADGLTDTSDRPFAIGTDTSNFTIVVLGSSTAAGNGASVADSSWVNRYADHLRRDTRFAVVNLGKGGYTTYQVQPTGTRNPDTIRIAVDRDRNTTAALGYDPAAIIVNLPSNDAARGFPARDQLANFDRMVAEADAAGVPVWIATTQPRNFSDVSLVDLQKEVRDSIFDRYGNRSIDFWNGLADASGQVDPAFDKGDGVHVNDAGHRLLFERVNAAGIDGVILAAATTVLPVELHAFLVSRTTATEARISWSVHGEHGLPTYLVERSITPGVWQEIALVPGTDSGSYTYNDTECPPDQIHYRLRMVDADGSTRYSPIRTVAEAIDGSALRAYPNPTRGTTTLVAGRAAAGRRGRVSDATGRTVASGTVDGSGTLTLDLSDRPAGLYTVRVGNNVLRIIRR